MREDEPAATAPVVVVCAAMGVPSAYYRRLADVFVAHGWDARLQPEPGVDPGTPAPSRRHDWGYADRVDALAATVAEERAAAPGRPVLVLGHSLGGQVAVGLQLRTAGPDGPGRRAGADALVLVGAGRVHHRRYPLRGLGIGTLGLLVPVVTRVVGHWPRPMFGAPMPSRLMREWAATVRHDRLPFEAAGPVDVPVLSVRLEDDHLAPPASVDGLDALVAPSRLTSATYRHVDAPPGGGVDHVRWVRTPEPVVARVVAWWTEVVVVAAVAVTTEGQRRSSPAPGTSTDGS